MTSPAVPSDRTSALDSTRPAPLTLHPEGFPVAWRVSKPALDRVTGAARAGTAYRAAAQSHQKPGRREERRRGVMSVPRRG
ncbi:hypothetical protein ACN28S_23480 [Cystobacter fuscus]